MKATRLLLKAFIGLMALLVSSACTKLTKPPPLTLQGFPQALQPGDIVDARSGAKVPFEVLIDQLAKARVIYVGETHMSIEDHRIQRRIVQGLYEKDPHLVLAMEMFPRQTQPVLDKYSAGLMSEQALLAESDWSEVWGYPFQLYRSLLTWAKDKHVRIVGLNAPPPVVRKIAGSGISSLSAEERRQIARDVNPDDPVHRTYVRQEYDRHVKENIKDFESFYAAQLAWEETMAETLAQTLASNKSGDRIIVLIGNGHIARDFGVPRRTWRRERHEYRTVVPVPVDSADRGIDPAIADYIWITKESTAFHHRGMLGVMLAPAAAGEGLEIKGVIPGSPAARAGVEKGDMLYRFDGKTVNSVDDIHQAVAAGESPVHRLGLKRGGEEVELQVILSP